MSKKKADVVPDELAQYHSSQLKLYAKGDRNRKRFALHNMIADIMGLAAEEKVDLLDLLTGGVDLYEQRGDEGILSHRHGLPSDGPEEFFRSCSQKYAR